MPKSVVMMSGGLDSSVTAFIARELNPGEDLYPIVFNYGQRHTREMQSAFKVAQKITSIAPVVVDLRASFWGLTGLTSLLADSSLVPQTSGVNPEEIPSTWVPHRNLLFLTNAFILAERTEASQVYTGFNAVDYSGYPDCRPEFVSAAENALNLGRKAYVEDRSKIHIRTPLIAMTKVQIVKRGLDLGVPFQDTYSCYYGEEDSCGACDSCRIRRAAFESLGTKDPVKYRKAEIEG